MNKQKPKKLNSQVSTGNLDFALTSFPTLQSAITGFESCLKNINAFPNLRRYVVVFGQGKLYNDPPRHTLLVRKPPDSLLHAGYLNLPGGKVEPGEKPFDATVREIREETGYVGTFPQLMGAILPSGSDNFLTEPFIVYIYRVLITSQSERVVTPEVEVHEPNWYTIHDLYKQKVVPGLPLICSLLASEQRCFVIQDAFWTTEGFWRTEEDILAKRTQKPTTAISQQIVTFYRPEFIESKETRKKERFTT